VATNAQDIQATKRLIRLNKEKVQGRGERGLNISRCLKGILKKRGSVSPEFHRLTIPFDHVCSELRRIIWLTHFRHYVCPTLFFKCILLFVALYVYGKAVSKRFWDEIFEVEVGLQHNYACVIIIPILYIMVIYYADGLQIIPLLTQMPKQQEGWQIRQANTDQQPSHAHPEHCRRVVSFL
jgi:hypothetical protein